MWVSEHNLRVPSKNETQNENGFCYLQITVFIITIFAMANISIIKKRGCKNDNQN